MLVNFDKFKYGRQRDRRCEIRKPERRNKREEERWKLLSSIWIPVRMPVVVAAGGEEKEVMMELEEKEAIAEVEFINSEGGRGLR